MVEYLAVPSRLPETPQADVLWNDWHVVATTQELQPGTLKPIRLLGKDLVMWRGQQKEVFAWEDRCPHRSVRLSNGHIRNDTLVCPYHGFVYDRTGQCIKVPAHPNYVPPKQACVRTYAVQEHYGLVFVCLGHPQTQVTRFPEWEDSTYLKILSGPHPCRTGGFRAIENFLDVAHFPFLHTHILGDPAKTEIGDYRVEVNERGVHFHDIRVWQPDPLGKGQGDNADYSYSVFRPLTAYLRKGTLEDECLAILYFVTPVDEENCIGWMYVAVNYMDPSQTEAVREFQDKIFLQDLANLESHNPKRLPLRPDVEFHVPCDRGSLAYRKWLQQLGVTYGVL